MGILGMSPLDQAICGRPSANAKESHARPSAHASCIAVNLDSMCYASFRLMRRQLAARWHLPNCGKVDERGSFPFAKVTHILRTAESACARRLCFACYSRKKVIPLHTVISPGAERTVLKSCVLNRRGTDRFDPASR